MSCLPDPLLAENLNRWLESGQPRRWVDAHCGGWSHADWLVLLGNLRHTDFWPMEPQEIGAVLERLKQEKANLRRWVESGQAHLWVATHSGCWEPADLASLVESLRQSAFWPLPADAVGRILEAIRSEWWSFRLWQDSGQGRRWVEAHAGQWNHADWLALVDFLQQSEFWPLNLAAVGEELERLQVAYRNVGRWRASGQGRRWVEARQGQWAHADWLALVAGLRQSEFWPLPSEAVGRDLERFAREWENLRRWQTSGQPRRWIQARRGKWDHGEWLALLGSLEESAFWPMQPAAVGQVLESLRDEAAGPAVLGGEPAYDPTALPSSAVGLSWLAVRPTQPRAA